MNNQEIKRRDFLKTSAKATMAAMFMGLGSSKLFAGQTLFPPENSIPSVKLNNGIKMPMLGFGTLYLTEELGVRCVADANSLG